MKILEEVCSLGTKKLPVKIHIQIYDEHRVTLPHWHKFLEILCIDEGQATLTVNQTSLQAKQGDILVFNAYDVHELVGIAKVLVAQFHVSLVTEYGVDLLKVCSVPDKMKLLPRSCDHTKRIHNNMKRMFENSTQQAPGYELDSLGTIFQIVSSIIFEFSGIIADDQMVDNHQEDLQRIEILLRYVEMNYPNKISLQDAAEILNLSPNYFCRFFKRVMGKSFFEYLNIYRCMKANELIYTTNKSITEIALSVGFSTINYFNKVYKKFQNSSPSKNRKRLPVTDNNTRERNGDR